MNDTKVFEYIMAWKNKLPADSLPLLQDELKKLPEDKAVNLSQIKLKSPIIGLILGIFLGGFAADRFYQGRIGLGIVKLLGLCIIIFIAGIVTGVRGDPIILHLLFIFWIMLDWYYVWKGIKQDNLTKINNQLSWIK